MLLANFNMLARGSSAIAPILAKLSPLLLKPLFQLRFFSNTSSNNFQLHLSTIISQKYKTLPPDQKEKISFTSFKKNYLSNIEEQKKKDNVQLLNSEIDNINSTIKTITTDLQNFKKVPADNLYATVNIQNFPYLITKGDLINLPYNLRQVEVGTTIKLNNISNLGSRDLFYRLPTSKEKNVTDLYLDNKISELIEIKAVCIEKAKNKAKHVKLERQRCRKNRAFITKLPKTILRIKELKINID
ncbi:mitochondrial 54S ribosomal protein bL21m MRPL49 ASCRUDRAFT_75627 [Ascoidea rubescens DSM 1968]|uniref:Large ribosomal subunit protein bL21m n=1 Tax=Ascoidea rubescens DSM 1968 TaxID=1344418 RepID=A0A1D2VJA1_9ASCO|nr:hypothetical protein ASCRUDRAFT_75627 [Ascoidea rubescens DSM 1968]ODV61640.1 hypothetical protein ASCRUDRAFT_75627 [Ascoidea rubescens DSM 1968]